MRVLKQITATVVILCVLALSAMGVEPQKNDQKGPPPKPPQDVENKKPPPPPREGGNKGGNDNKRGKP